MAVLSRIAVSLSGTFLTKTHFWILKNWGVVGGGGREGWGSRSDLKVLRSNLKVLRLSQHVSFWWDTDHFGAALPYDARARASLILIDE